MSCRKSEFSHAGPLNSGVEPAHNAVWLAQQGFEVTGVDLSSLAVDRARARAADAGVRVRFLTADVLHPPALGVPFSFFFDRGCYHVVRRTNLDAYLHTLEECDSARRRRTDLGWERPRAA